MKALIVLALLAVLSASQAEQWTAYFPADAAGDCLDPLITSGYDLISLATDSQGRPWQFTGRGCSGTPAFLRYFDRTARNWTLAWTALDSAGPAARSDNVMWIDKDDNVYIYGGLYNCDFWKFSPGSQTWTELTVGGGSLNSVEKGVENSENYPGCKRGSGYWYTPDDNSLWLFSSYDDNIGGPLYPDLWRYNVTSKMWAFVAGLLEPIVTDDPTFADAFEVTPFQRWAPLTAVDPNYNLWLYGGETVDDLWMFNRSSGWQYISGNKNVSSLTNGCTATVSTLPPGVFSAEHRPDCGAYSSMTYAGNNILALWISYSYQGGVPFLWLYNITSQEWAYYNDTLTKSAVANVLYQPDAATTPGYTAYTRTFAPGSLWVIADKSGGVYVMDFPQCSQTYNPCSEHATCSENVGQVSPTCTCNQGYEGDGFTCTAVSASPVSPVSAPVAAPSGTKAPSSTSKSSASRLGYTVLAVGLSFLLNF